LEISKFLCKSIIYVVLQLILLNITKQSGKYNIIRVLHNFAIFSSFFPAEHLNSSFSFQEKNTIYSKQKKNSTSISRHKNLSFTPNTTDSLCHQVLTNLNKSYFFTGAISLPFLSRSKKIYNFFLLNFINKLNNLPFPKMPSSSTWHRAIRSSSHLY